VLFLGDSIIESLQFTETWNTFFAPLHCLNFSIQQDKVENVLWRIENGELEFVKPKVIVLHVGTNNTKNGAEAVAEGIERLIQTIRKYQPDVYIVFPTLLPRGQTPNQLREKNEKVNQLIAERCANMNKVQM
jgi:platelet-activating factor acetylhydrolase IB subunit beta/gamma